MIRTLSAGETPVGQSANLGPASRSTSTARHVAAAGTLALLLLIAGAVCRHVGPSIESLQ